MLSLVVGAQFSFFVGVVVVNIMTSGGIPGGSREVFPKWVDKSSMCSYGCQFGVSVALLALVLVAILGRL
jgi:dipeptide transport system permease protein